LKLLHRIERQIDDPGFFGLYLVMKLRSERVTPGVRKQDVSPNGVRQRADKTAGALSV
jgi:hypothetical protein